MKRNTLLFISSILNIPSGLFLLIKGQIALYFGIVTSGPGSSLPTEYLITSGFILLALGAIFIIAAIVGFRNYSKTEKSKLCRSFGLVLIITATLYIAFCVITGFIPVFNSVEFIIEFVTMLLLSTVYIIGARKFNCSAPFLHSDR